MTEARLNSTAVERLLEILSTQTHSRAVTRRCDRKLWFGVGQVANLEPF
jgi:hypothetical protein